MANYYPIVGGLNGDHPDTLRDQFGKNLMILEEAIARLSSNMPNGRNYRSDDYRAARAEYQEHLDKLIEARDYMLDQLEHLDKHE